MSFASLKKKRLTVGGRTKPTSFFLGLIMDHLKLYEVDAGFISFVSSRMPLLFHNKKTEEVHNRKYIGIVLSVNGFNYFAPLSSFKEKHLHMPDTIDFIKIGRRAVINLNCMLPVPSEKLLYVDINAESDYKYRSLLQIEYRFIRKNQERIRRNANEVYKQKKLHPETKLAKRCNDFTELEKLIIETTL